MKMTAIKKAKHRGDNWLSAHLFFNKTRAVYSIQQKYNKLFYF
jgi:hypothetical protein